MTDRIRMVRRRTAARRRPGTPTRRTLGLACVALVTASTTACASFEGARPGPGLIDSRLHIVPVLAAKTSIEAEPVDDGKSRSAGRTTATHAVLWTGVVLASLGGAGLIGFGSASYATDSKLSRGYAEDGLTRDEADTLINRGEALNTATIISASVGLLGALMAVTAYGVEYTNCGPLAPKSRRCSER